MALGRQWETRLRMWRDGLEKSYIRQAFMLDVEFFKTFEQLSFEQAKQGSFEAAPVGTKWGEKWEYGWFRTKVTVPDVCAGKRLCLHLGIAGEMLVFVNGVESGAIDKQHDLITLTTKAMAGEEFEIYAEAYAGHGVRREDAGPFGIDEVTVPENIGLQIVTKPSFVVEWNEDLFQAYMDYLCLYDLFTNLPEKSLRRMKIIEGLKEFTYIADFELPYEEMIASIIEGRKVLKPLLECHNGSTAPKFTIFGQSHLDLAWLWHEGETKRKSARTYSNQLKLMEEYPEYKFLMCSPTVLNYAKEYYPDLYKRIKNAKDEGRFIPEGAMWIESDTNIPSGESLIRQFVKGKRWFREEMGTESVMAWMPDTFGYSGALPQIMKKTGVKYFATQKLLRADPETEQFPYNVFWWEGIDGSRILTHIFKKNNSRFTPKYLIERWENDRNQEENIDGMIFPFGFGDGGGGATRVMLEQARRCKDLEGAPRCTYGSPVEFFEGIDTKKVKNEYAGELYLAWHRGTLTSQTETKRGIRKAEEALHNLEFFISMAILSDMEKEPKVLAAKAELAHLWEELLFCQFHDIAPGTSIERVHKEAVERLTTVQLRGKELIEKVMKTLADGNLFAGKEVAFNAQSFEKSVAGNVVPAYGYAELTSKKALKNKVAISNKNGNLEVTNSVFTCVVDKQGRIVSLVGKDGKEYVEKPWNEFLMFKDVNTDYDAWELGSMYENLPVELSEDALIDVTYEGENGVITVKKTLHNSVLEQRIVIKPDSARIDFETKIDWQERHKILKASFPAAVYTKEAIENIQFGYVKRPTHRSKQSDKDRYEVSNQKYTALADGGHLVAVMNDCKYGVSVVENDIRLTLLRAPLVPDMNTDKGEHEFTYSVYTFNGSLKDSELLKEAYDLNSYPLVYVKENAQAVEKKSENPVSCGLFTTSATNVVIETVKPSDFYEDAVVLRVYEALGSETKADITIPSCIKSAYETDMLEEGERKLSLEDGKLKLHFDTFEIKTIVLKKK